MTTSTRRGRSAEGRAEVRRRLVAAAARLFTERGYDDTTVDDIAAAAEVGRRTFFRYFHGKEDALSPDHERGLARISEVFDDAHPGEPLPSLVLRAAETVFDLYTDDPDVARLRFALVGSVPALRDREAASVHHYRRLFTRELTARLTGRTDGELVAAVTAAALVAAHNQALRRWLADGARPADLATWVAHFRKVAPMLPLAENRPAEPDLESVTRRLERAAQALERDRHPG
ncbi:TetR family transcriptional regulator [Pseudonocardia sp. HH130630-07]|uniref:TetR family transcriptional regulator n=1 Tax=Pseudonocardia sp. HH130630-07 TaxID=1690815 RepID=UPI000815257B|nr:TetR family transcriptional regulator [Pseudonocardia sp. HH130630-07]ANY07563.1 TetR family transcriptional regulator [Pseudonocardia sp. HH130630-07]